MNKYGYLAVGGVAGTFARYALATAVHRFTGENFPYGTLAVNLSGCFLIGFLAALSGERLLLTPNARLLLVTGFCGAFTTFSALILETGGLLQHGQAGKALLYVLASVGAGFLIFRAGVSAGEFF